MNKTVSKNKAEDPTVAFGNILAVLLSQYFNDKAWYFKSYERNKSGVVFLLEALTVTVCSGLTEKFTMECIARLDLYRLPDYYPHYADKIKNLKNRYCLLDINHIMRDYLPGITGWDIDAEMDLIDRLIEKNS